MSTDYIFFFLPDQREKLNPLENFVGDTNIVHIPTTSSDDITDFSVSLPVHNIEGKTQLFPL